MKKIVSMLFAIVLVFACEKHTSEFDQATQLFPERPVFEAGETNAHVKFKSATAIATTDLNTLTPADLVAQLVGIGPAAPVVSNITYTGAPVAAGIFTDAAGVFGFENGIVLSSGDVGLIVGPNVSDGITGNNGLPGDPDLDLLIPGHITHDATVLEFDFECEYMQVISFQYVFASDEYNEYVNSPYNDVFGFFLNGVNIALIPETTTPVAINNLNCGNPYAPPGGSHCELYINNDLSDGGGTHDTEMDGFTIVLTATAELLPGVNHIKLAIADAGDRILDSDVLIKGESFVCAPPYVEVPFDVHPTSCPNPLNRKGKGVVPVAILGTEDFDVTQIDVATVKIFNDPEMEGISPLRWAYEDVSTPYQPYLEKEGMYACNTEGPDGFDDLTLKFDQQEFAALFAGAETGDVVKVTITGFTRDGDLEILGEDVMIVRQ